MSTAQDKLARAGWVTVMIESHGRKTSPPQLAGYELALSDIPPDEVRQAVESHLRRADDHPASPGRLRELCGVVSNADRALLAWQVVVDNTGVGSYRSVDFDDGLINATIRSMGGWIALLDRGGDDFDVWARKTFIETYEAYARAGVSGDSCRPLPGLSDTGTHEVIGIDGTARMVELPGPVAVKTGLPALPGVTRPRLEDRADVPRVEFQKP